MFHVQKERNKEKRKQAFYIKRLSFNKKRFFFTSKKATCDKGEDKIKRKQDCKASVSSWAQKIISKE